MKKFTPAVFFATIFPAILVLFIIFFIVMPKVRQERAQVNNITHTRKENISWDAAKIILNNGEVKQIFQSHQLDVILTLKNGAELHTEEPKIDDIFKEVEKCGEICKDIILATE
jgi:hypothetical protein